MQVLANFHNSLYPQNPKISNISSNFSESSTPQSLEFKHKKHKHDKNNTPKIAVVASTAAGVALATAIMFKHKKFSLNIKNMFKTNPSKWAIFNVKYDSSKHEVEKLVSLLAFGSVGGGLLGGALFDKKENLNAKLRESIIQLVGNIFTPLLCVSGGIHMFENFAEKKIVSALKLSGNSAKVPKIVASAGLLVSAIFAGNKIGNLVNEKIFHVKDDRKLKLSDMSPHIDDACLALSLVASESSKAITRVIPLALMVAGISTGTAQERPERLHHNK